MEATGVRLRTGTSSSSPETTAEYGEPTVNTETPKAGSVPPLPSAPAAEPSGNAFECNICLETPNDPVVTLCGHLFCWACLYRWLRNHAQRNECPVCKAGVEEDKVVPLYGRGKAQSDPRTRPVPEADIPHRPNARRPEPTRNAHAREAPAFGFFPGVGGPFAAAQIGGFTVSAGFGLFPALFGWNFPMVAGFHGGGFPAYGGAYGAAGGVQAPGRNTVAEEQNAFLSRLLMALGLFVLFAIVFA